MDTGESVVRSSQALLTCTQVSHYEKKTIGPGPIHIGLICGGYHWKDLKLLLQVPGFQSPSARIGLIGYDCMCDTRGLFSDIWIK